MTREEDDDDARLLLLLLLFVALAAAALDFLVWRLVAADTTGRRRCLNSATFCLISDRFLLLFRIEFNLLDRFTVRYLLSRLSYGTTYLLSTDHSQFPVLLDEIIIS